MPQESVRDTLNTFSLRPPLSHSVHAGLEAVALAACGGNENKFATTWWLWGETWHKVPHATPIGSMHMHVCACQRACLCVYVQMHLPFYAPTLSQHNFKFCFYRKLSQLGFGSASLCCAQSRSCLGLFPASYAPVCACLCLSVPVYACPQPVTSLTGFCFFSICKSMAATITVWSPANATPTSSAFYPSPCPLLFSLSLSLSVLLPLNDLGRLQHSWYFLLPVALVARQ